MKNDISHSNIESHVFCDDRSSLSDVSMSKLYEFMFRLRFIEDEIKRRYHPADLMRCPVHLCVGQEAVPGALSLLLKDHDFLFSHHRSHGHYLAKKCGLRELIFELHGLKEGVNSGLAGSQDISCSRNRFYAGAILAGTVGIAMGAAAATQHRREDSAIVCCFGEAATEQGIFWEALNYASLKKLPILFVCENNNYATYSHSRKRQPEISLAKKSQAFGVNAANVFGNDALAVHHALKEGLGKLAEGPSLINAITYRVSSHVGPEDDSQYYRSPSEIKYWQALCPLEALGQRLPIAGQQFKEEIRIRVRLELDIIFAEARSAVEQKREVPDWPSSNLSLNDQNHRISILASEPEDSVHNKDTVPGPY
jgi:TPP-dependent pyruvate/acetoin dehydrogenase alpha subunit